MIRRIALLLGLLLALALWPPTTQAQTPGVACNLSKLYDNSTNGSTLLVTGRSNANIYICGYTFYAASTVNLKLVYGSDATCGTGTTAITPAFQFTTQTGLVDPSPVFRGLFVPLGNNLCINASAGNAAQAIVYYAFR
jgi:hypothetical protein